MVVLHTPWLEHLVLSQNVHGGQESELGGAGTPVADSHSDRARAAQPAAALPDTHCTERVRVPPQLPSHDVHGPTVKDRVAQGHVAHGASDAGAGRDAQSTVGFPDTLPSDTRTHCTVRLATPPPQGAEHGPHGPAAHVNAPGQGPVPQGTDCSDADTPQADGGSTARVTLLAHSWNCALEPPPPHTTEQSVVGRGEATGAAHKPLLHAVSVGGRSVPHRDSATDSPLASRHTTSRLATPAPQVELHGP